MAIADLPVGGAPLPLLPALRGFSGFFRASV
jgi:hypothetical protein